MSADEPGYVPPDHKTTAEFRVPARPPAGPPAEDAAEAEATLVDRPLPDDRDEPGETATDPMGSPVAPATVTDLAADDPVDVRALPADDVPEDLPADGPEDGPRDRHVAAAGGIAGGQDPGPGEWTEMFGQEEARRRAPTAPHPGLAASASPLAAAAVPPGAQPARPDVPQESPQPGVPGPTPPAGQAAAQPLPPPAAPQGHLSPEAPTPSSGMPAGPVPPPPGQPVASAMPVGAPVPQPAAPARRRSPAPLLVTVAAVLVIGVIGAAVALVLTSGGEDSKRTVANPTTGATPGSPGTGGSGAPTPGRSGPGVPPGGTPGPGGSPQGVPPGQVAPSPTPPPRDPIGPVLKGKGLTYQLVQRDPGYYEGLLIITNRGDKPMKKWTLTFETPKANVKNIWGGELVHGGDRVEIRSLDGAPAIQPGATWEVRFGAEGAPVAPKDCRLNDRRCGFE